MVNKLKARALRKAGGQQEGAWGQHSLAVHTGLSSVFQTEAVTMSHHGAVFS